MYASTIEMREVAAEQQSVAAYMEAEDRLCADMDLYSDWLTSHCIDKPASHTRINYVPRSDASLQNFIDALDVSQLQAATLYPRAEVSFRAAQRLRSLYVEQHADYLAKLAGDCMGEVDA